MTLMTLARNQDLGTDAGPDNSGMRSRKIHIHTVEVPICLGRSSSTINTIHFVQQNVPRTLAWWTK
jgi:hypothetical protein